MTAAVKGNILLARLAFLRGRGGQPLVDRVVSRVPANDQRVLRGTLLATSAYPLGVNLRFDDAIAEELSPGDPDRVFLEMGRASAEVNLTGSQRGLVRQGDPHYLLAFTESIYGYYYAVGRRTYQKTGPTSAVLTTIGAEEVTATDCLTVVGWHQRAIELCGGTSVEVTHPKCRVRGDNCCEYRIEWK
jgi:uncharacterized protein (TIGR02265 family)